MQHGVPWTRWRRCSQLLVLFVFGLFLPVTYRFGQVEVLGTLASIKLGPLSLVDPATGISMILASGMPAVGLLGGLVLPVLLALVAGPVFCAWACPFGLLSEWLDQLLRRRQWRVYRVRKLRWAALVAVMLGSVLSGLPLVATLSAPRVLSALPMEILFLGGAFSSSVALLAAFVVLELLLPRRLWCRALCPVGSVLVLLRSPVTLRPHWRAATCDPGACGELCFTRCPWNLDPRRLAPLDGCTNCGLCIENCPATPQRALSFRRRLNPGLPVL